ncbi:hypothetical protein QQS21_001298 [Conoideocrella luteorostrata]|uniref:Cytochrome b561 domain-containing protein n=1 Tax=Conoideocrella luteorostrata TaxID=1105319 RepID=A0AAJ0CXA0_9HYPO|nr:hypothetical protein QQS21_001298 [Conoideocrella luteorostrata]
MKPLPAVAAFCATILYHAVLTSAQKDFSVGEQGDVRVQCAITKSTSKPDLENLFLQIDAPDTYSWVAVGMGTAMKNAEIYMIYQNGQGNVTLSTRNGRDHIMPLYAERRNVNIVSGSGVIDGRMKANIRCDDCGSFLGAGKHSSWVSAWSRGVSLESSNPSAVIPKHDGKTLLQLDLEQAQVSSDADPFSWSGRPANGDGVKVLDDASGRYRSMRLAHGIIMTIVFVLLYPTGALLIPLFNKWYLHSISQLVSYALMWVAFGLGLTYAKHEGLFLQQPHTKLGLSVVLLLSIQPILGWLHHRYVTKHQVRGWVSKIHTWYGRTLMLLGIINGGLGLQLVGDPAGERTGAWVVAYSVVAGLASLAYITALVYRRLRKPSRRKHRTSDAVQQPQDFELRFDASDPKWLRNSAHNQ